MIKKIEMIYDTIIIGAGAAGMFAGICLEKNSKKLILEKTAKPGIKVLMSGGERANVSNADIEPTRDYFTQNKKFLHSIFSKYTQWDIMSFFAENDVEIVEEDRNRLILKSGDSKELLNCLLKNLEKNNCPIKTHQDVKSVIKNKEDIFEIETGEGKKYQTKSVIISSGGKSFPQIGTTGEAYEIAKKLDLKIVHPYRTLCGLATKQNLSEISGVSTDLEIILKDKNNEKLEIYKEFGPLLFTHFGFSGPIIHNLSNALGEYLNKVFSGRQQQKTKSLPLQGGDLEGAFETYILENMFVELRFDIEKTPKRVVKFFSLKKDFDTNVKSLCPSDISLSKGDSKSIVKIELQNWRSWREAKATGGGVSTDNLDNHMQVKKYPGLYFIGEAVDVTGKTGGFNLQWAWSSAFVASENINLKKI